MRFFAKTKAFLGLACVLFLFQAHTSAQAQFAAGTDYMSRDDVEEISDGLYTFRWGAYRSMFMVTDEGVIVTDPMSVEAARIYREAIRSVTDKPVRFVVYSHAQWDRASGAQIFKDEGAVIVAQEKCVEELEISPHPDVLMPDITFSDQYDLKLGGRTLSLSYFGPSVGRCLSVMQPRPAKALYIVNLVSPPVGWEQPWDPTLSNHHLYNIIPYLKQVEALAERENIDSVIGGFIGVGINEKGSMVLLPPDGPVSAIRETREFWEALFAAVKEQSDKGVWSENVPRKMDRTKFENIKGYNKEAFDYIAWRVAEYYFTGK